MIKTRFYIAFLVVLFTCLSAFSQTKRQLEQQRKKLNKEIVQVNNLLFQEQKKEKNVLGNSGISCPQIVFFLNPLLL